MENLNNFNFLEKLQITYVFNFSSFAEKLNTNTPAKSVLQEVKTLLCCCWRIGTRSGDARGKPKSEPGLLFAGIFLSHTFVSRVKQ